MKFPIDRIEGDKIIVELPDCSTTDIDINLAPEAKEGMLLDINVVPGDKNEVSSLFKSLF